MSQDAVPARVSCAVFFVEEYQEHLALIHPALQFKTWIRTNIRAPITDF